MNKNWDFILGGIVSVITLTAIVFKFILSGDYDSTSLLDFAINIGSVLVSVLVFVVAIKSLLNLHARESFDTVLNRELDSWVERNTPMISKDLRVKTGVRYFMQSDHDNVFKVGECGNIETTGQKGAFVQLPDTFSENAQIIFFLNKSTFMRRAKAKDSDTDTEIAILINKIANCISAKFSRELFEASGDEKHNQIYVSIKRQMNTPDDARELVKMIEYVEMLYMAAA